MVLQQYMASINLSEVGPFHILAFGYQFAICIAFSLVLQNLCAIEPMLHMVVLGNNMGRGPFPDRIDGLIDISLNQIVQRCHCTTTFMVPQLCIWMPFIIQNLIFQTN